MSNFNFKALAIAMIAIAGMPSYCADAAQNTLDSRSHVAKMLSTVWPVRQFRGERPFYCCELNGDLLKRNLHKAPTADNGAIPSLQFPELSTFDFLDGPDGSTWFYTADYDYNTVDFGYGYTEDYITGFTFTIYDSSFKEVGRVHDTVTLKADETRAVSVTLDPAVSVNFFNDDSKNEVIVYLAVNTASYVNRYYNKVYSIGGEKDGDYDKCFYEFEGRIVDVLNVGNDTYFTIATDIIPDIDDYDDFVDYVNAYAYHVETFKGMDNKILEYDVNLSNIPGDTTDGIYFISKVENGTPYFIYSHYELPYFVDPTGFAQDESATPGNSLIIDVFNGATCQKVSTTSIPVVIEKVEGKLTYCFYSIGSLAWRDDIIMNGPYGSPSAPAFIVASDFCLASNLEEVESTFDIYKTNGTKAKTLSQASDGLVKLSDIEGKEPQAMFVEAYGENNYLFHFVDLWSGIERATIHQANGGDPISAVGDRVPSGNNGYKYAFEMTYYVTDDNGNENTRVAWFNSDGSLDRIDRINVGKDVMASSVNMTQKALDPDLFDDSDSSMEYAVLVKRTSGATTKNEFVVVDDNGDWLARFSEDDGKGLPFMFTLVYGLEGNHLQMVYNDNYKYNVDIYELPLRSSASVIDSLTYGYESSITFDGKTVIAKDAFIELYNSTGVKVAVGKGLVSVASLVSGVYIAVATDAQGTRSTSKISF